VVKCESLKERAKKVERFVTIANHLRELHNYNSVQSILAGLTTSPVHRLKKTWAVSLLPTSLFSLFTLDSSTRSSSLLMSWSRPLGYGSQDRRELRTSSKVDE
jgi:son of sevenless-like protein